MSVCFVLDDWLLNDLGGDNGPEKRQETVNLLEALYRKCDRIAMLQDTSWTKKVHSLMGKNDERSRKINKPFWGMIFLNTGKCDILSEAAPLPQNMQQLIPHSDHYLFRTYLAVDAQALVTTDQKLIDQVSGTQLDITIRHRDEFLAEYLSADTP